MMHWGGAWAKGLVFREGMANIQERRHRKVGIPGSESRISLWHMSLLLVSNCAIIELV